MHLVIDIGNTSAKIAVFSQEEMINVVRSSNQSLEGLDELCQQYPIKKGIWASVISMPEEIQQQLQQLPFPMTEFTYQTPIPIRNLYKTPQTLPEAITNKH